MKLIYDTINETLLPWPRIDDEPVVGLDPHLLEMTVVQEDEPTYDPATEVLEQTQTIDTEAKTVTRVWNVVDLPPSVVSAEAAVAQYFSPYQIAALSRLELALLQAGQPLGPAMSETKAWLESVMLGWATDPTPRAAAEFGVPTVSFEVACAEAVAGLQQI
jgi:hypothetical protein